MPSFTVTAVDTKVRDWNSEAGGTMRAYKMKVQDAAGTEHTVEWSRKLSSPPPEPGQTLEGEIVQGQYGARFKKSQGGGFGARPEDPKRAARILRQHSQDMALRTIKLAVDLNLMKVQDPERPGDSGGYPETTAELFSLIAKTADWFDKDAEAAAQ